MSAPPGWHLQPDGRERFWDGAQWTGQFRAPAMSDPTAPPPAPSWASSDGTSSTSDSGAAPDDGRTRAMDVRSTQELPATPPAAAPDPYATNPYGTAPQPPYPAPYPAAGVPQAGYPQTGYGSPGDPGAGWQPPQKSGGSGLLKGCLIAVVVGVVVLVGVIIAGIFFLNRAVDDVRDSFPSNFPTDFPSDFPSDVPTDGMGEKITITVGKGFEVPRAQVQDGWTLAEEGALGVETAQIKNMKARLSEEGVPVFFTISFPTTDGGSAETVCSSESAEAGGTVDVQCVPLFGDVGDATEGTVTTTF